MMPMDHAKPLQLSIAVSLLVHVVLFGLATGLFRFGAEISQHPVGVEVGIAKLGGGAPSGTPKPATPAPSKAKPAQKKQPAAQKAPKAKKQVRQDATARKDTVSLKPKATNTKPQTTAKPQPESKASSVPKDNEKQQTPKQNVLSGLDSLLKKHKSETSGSGTGSGKGNATGAGKGEGQAALSGIAGNIYLGSLTQKISSYWDVPNGLDSKGLFARVAIRISRNGVLEKAELVQSSGSELFDVSALAALQAAAPFDAVPSTMQAPLEFVIRLVPPEDM